MDNTVTGALWHTHTDAKGHYVVEKLSSGRYELRVEAKGTGCVIISQIVVEEDNRVMENVQFTTRNRLHALLERLRKNF